MLEYDKKKIEAMILLIMLILIFVISVYAIKMQNDYNEVVELLNNCTKSCLPIWR